MTAAAPARESGSPPSPELVQRRLAAADAHLPDPHWRAVAVFLAGTLPPGGLILAPNDFLAVFRGTIADHMRRDALPEARFAFFVLHKGPRLDRVDEAFLREALDGIAVFANPVFVICAPAGTPLPPAPPEHVQALLEQAAQRPLRTRSEKAVQVIGTHNRAWALRRTLGSLRHCRAPIIVVDDGSTGLNRWHNRRATCRAGALYIGLPDNCGLAYALNVGLSRALADPDTAWISVTNDDVAMAPAALAVLAAVARAAPGGASGTVVTGYDSPAHPHTGEGLLGGHAVAYARSHSGQHIFAHRQYWQAVMPIPTQYRGAPRRGGGLFEGHASDEDWWVGSWAPASAVKRGFEVVVVPGLVTTFGQGRSSWGGPGR